MSAADLQERQRLCRQSDSSVRSWIQCTWKRIRRSFSPLLRKVGLFVTLGARKEETDENVRKIALGALFSSLEFIKSHFENEGLNPGNKKERGITSCRSSVKQRSRPAQKPR
jgi:hypothetical protein